MPWKFSDLFLIENSLYKKSTLDNGPAKRLKACRLSGFKTSIKQAFLVRKTGLDENVVKNNRPKTLNVFQDIEIHEYLHKFKLTEEFRSAYKSASSTYTSHLGNCRNLAKVRFYFLFHLSNSTITNW